MNSKPASGWLSSIGYAKRIEVGEGLGLMGLAGLAVFFIATSWRKWPDPLIDFGRELYLPWRIANGAVLYRDVFDIYGPLSHCFNAVLFKCFGPGLMVLVTANLVIFFAIWLTLYILCRRAWGVGAALAASVVFVAVFGFSQFVPVGNYNFATPYTHETTHGFLVCLLLLVVLARWVKAATLSRTFIVGGLFGLTCVLKPEIMLAAGLITFAAVGIRWRYHWQLKLPMLAAWAGGAMLPTLGFVAYFSAYLPWKEAARVSCAAWLNVVGTTRYSSGLRQEIFLGTDRPWMHAWEHVGATLLAGLLIAVLAGAAWLGGQTPRRKLRLLFGGSVVGALFWLASYQIEWMNTGRCLLGLMLCYTFVSGSFLFRKPVAETIDQAQIIRLLMAVLATSLMARMVLNGRIFHFGYYQAALAGLLVPAVLIGELPMRFKPGSFGRSFIPIGSLALLVPGVWILASDSQDVYSFKTYAVGDGKDRFYAFRPSVEPSGEIVNRFSEWLGQTPRNQTLLELPEGLMINYLARLPGPPAPADSSEEAFVSGLKKCPPDWVVIVSRDLRENGVQRYGETSGQGQQILSWVNANYVPALTMGGDPLDPRQRGGVILKRK
jgi:hypothetical protein